MDCLFCKIAAGEIPADVVYRDDDVVVFSDINPQAPQHVLAITRKHYANVAELAVADPDLLSKLFATAAKAGQERDTNGFRLVSNTGTQAGQTVHHVHVHILSGRPFTWPPG